MSYNTFSPIVTNGLVLCLDAGNTKSYPSSGTTWSDLTSNGNNGTLVNGGSGLTFSSANGGSLVFDGVNDYVSSFSQQISDSGSKTIEVWFRVTTTGRVGLCGTPASSGVNGWAFVVNRTTTGNLTYFHNGGTVLEVAAGILNNIWYQACVTYNLYTSTSVLYLNGSQIGTRGGFSTISVSSFNGIIGNEDQLFTSPFRGDIAINRIYNRALAAAEVLQNYNATKGRFV